MVLAGIVGERKRRWRFAAPPHSTTRKVCGRFRTGGGVMGCGGRAPSDETAFGGMRAVQRVVLDWVLSIQRFKKKAAHPGTGWAAWRHWD